LREGEMGRCSPNWQRALVCWWWTVGPQPACCERYTCTCMRATTGPHDSDCMHDGAAAHVGSFDSLAKAHPIEARPLHSVRTMRRRSQPMACAVPLSACALALLLALSSVMVTSAGASSSAQNMATRCTVGMRHAGPLLPVSFAARGARDSMKGRILPRS
jgi:hypothetical protein